MQVFFGATNKKSYGKKKACPFCLETFFPTATDRKGCVTQSQVRDKVLQLSEKEKSEFMSHVESCICDQMVGLDFHELTLFFFNVDSNLFPQRESFEF